MGNAKLKLARSGIKREWPSKAPRAAVKEAVVVTVAKQARKTQGTGRYAPASRVAPAGKGDGGVDDVVTAPCGNGTTLELQRLMEDNIEAPPCGQRVAPRVAVKAVVVTAAKRRVGAMEAGFG